MSVDVSCQCFFGEIQISLFVYFKGSHTSLLTVHHAEESDLVQEACYAFLEVHDLFSL